MRTKRNIGYFFISLILLLSLVYNPAFAEETKHDRNLDAKVKIFLESIIKNNYKKAVDIGTSTGHSAIWMAWALSKTGGKLITIEIDEGRYKKAVANFKAAGLSDFIDARLADAHELVVELEGPFDFVFSDADKEWYKNYFIAFETTINRSSSAGISISCKIAEK
jgi:predicted O-methyltransferase YrrM